MLLFVLLMFALIALMVKLSLWQWQRSEQKQRLLDQYQQQSLVQSSLQQALAHGPVPFQLVKVSDIERLDYAVWLDNQVQKGQVGYDAYVVGHTAQGNVLLRLGWYKASYDRTLLPLTSDVEILPADYRLRQVSLPIVLDQQHWLEDLPQGLRVQQLNVEALAEYWQIDLLPFVLDSQLDHSPKQLVSISPQKHRGYSVQWLLMALVAAGLTGYFYWHNRDKEPS